MESMTTPPDRPDEALRVAERAAAAPFVEYPELPAWYPLVFGSWFTALLGTGAYRWPAQTGLRLAVTFTLVALLGAFFRWYRDARGVEQSLDARKAPPEIGREMRGYYVGATLCVLTMFACWAFAAPAITVAVTFTLSTVGIAVYERRYRRAAATVRERLR